MDLTGHSAVPSSTPPEYGCFPYGCTRAALTVQKLQSLFQGVTDLREVLRIAVAQMHADQPCLSL